MRQLEKLASISSSGRPYCARLRSRTFAGLEIAGPAAASPGGEGLRFAGGVQAGVDVVGIQRRQVVRRQLRVPLQPSPRRRDELGKAIRDRAFGQHACLHGR